MIHRASGVRQQREVRGLDRIDTLILKSLQANGRKSVTELSREVHLSPSPCLARVRRLEGDGYIQGYAALLDPGRLAARLLAFVVVRVDRTAPGILREFRDGVYALEEVIECHMIAGNFDYLIKIRVADMDAYRTFFGERLAMLPGIVHAHTFVAMEEVKSTLSIQF